MKAIHINAREKKVVYAEVDRYKGLRQLQSMVEGFIEQAGKLPGTGEALWVNEEGLLKRMPYGFRLAGVPGDFVGNGAIAFSTRDCKATVEAVEAMVEWI